MIDDEDDDLSSDIEPGEDDEEIGVSEATALTGSRKQYAERLHKIKAKVIAAAGAVGATSTEFYDAMEADLKADPAFYAANDKITRAAKWYVAWQKDGPPPSDQLNLAGLDIEFLTINDSGSPGKYRKVGMKSGAQLRHLGEHAAIRMYKAAQTSAKGAKYMSTYYDLRKRYQDNDDLEDIAKSEDERQKKPTK